MNTTKKPKDNRSVLYTSVRISKKAYAALGKKAKKDHRTIIATLEAILGV